MMKLLTSKIGLFISLGVSVVLFLSILYPFMLPGNPSNYKTEGTDIVFRYEIFGCGSLIRTIESGGEAIYEVAGLPDPESGVFEIKFTDDSEEPREIFDSAEFYTAGIARKYSYFMRVEVVGLTEGAPECCAPEPAYNETVPLVRVIKWEPTVFLAATDFGFRQIITAYILFGFVVFAFVQSVILFAQWLRQRNQAL